MNVNEVKKKLEDLKNPNHQEFIKKLVPGNIPVLGIKNPVLKKIAREIVKKDYKSFLDTNDFSSYELMMIHAYVIGLAKDDIDVLLKYFDNFVNLINDWAVFDILCSSFKIAKREQEKVWNLITSYKKSTHPFKLRVMTVMMLCYFLNDSYIDYVINILDSIKHDHYYTKMGIAWAFATIMTKYRDKCLAYLESSNLDRWTYNKAIQKMIESYRISPEDKNLLRTMKR